MIMRINPHLYHFIVQSLVALKMKFKIMKIVTSSLMPVLMIIAMIMVIIAHYHQLLKLPNIIFKTTISTSL